jgi:hypothetical protein
MIQKRLIASVQAALMIGFLSFAGQGLAGESATTASAKSSDEDVARLKAQVASQQEQIDQLRQALEEQKKMIGDMLKPSAAFSLPRTNTLGEVASLAPVIGPAAPLPPAIKSVNLSQGADVKPPMQFRIGDTYFTPVGFMDLSYISRSTNVGSSVGTNFGGIPFNNSVRGKLSESTLTIQNSRVGFRAESMVKGAHVTGYLETDFLGNAPTNLFVSTNSDTLRLRLYWVDVVKDHWEVLGGQTWSLLTPNRKGLSPLPGNIFFTQNVDTNYQIGLTWTRAPEFRFVWHPNDHIAWAFAAENPQQYIGGSSGAGTITLPPALSGGLANQLNDQTTGTNVPNLHPDFMSKIAFDATPSGHAVHVELGGVIRSFKVGYLASALFPSDTTYTKTGGGVEFNSNIELFKGFRIIENAYFSQGGGRYIFGQAPDLIINRDGRPSLIRAASTVDGLEWQATPKLLLYGYYGGMFVGKGITVLDPVKGVYAGYGYPGSPGGQNRSIQEATFGFQHTFWKDDNYGALSLFGQYSYLFRNPWAVQPGGVTEAHSNMIFANLRYTLPAGKVPTLK